MDRNESSGVAQCCAAQVVAQRSEAQRNAAQPANTAQRCAMQCKKQSNVAQRIKRSRPAQRSTSSSAMLYNTVQRSAEQHIAAQLGCSEAALDTTQVVALHSAVQHIAGSSAAQLIMAERR